MLLRDVKTDRSHKFDAVAGGYHAGAETIIERQPIILKFFLKMNVADAVRKNLFQRGQSQIVGGDQPDGAVTKQRSQNAFSADAAIVRIGALKNFVEEKE